MLGPQPPPTAGLESGSVWNADQVCYVTYCEQRILCRGRLTMATGPLCRSQHSGQPSRDPTLTYPQVPTDQAMVFTEARAKTSTVPGLWGECTGGTGLSRTRPSHTSK